MNLKKLWIQDYKKYRNSTISFEEESGVTSFQKELFGNLDITLFSGENGSGKTTILNFIAIIFKHIERFRERIPCDYYLIYSIKVDGIEREIKLSYEGKKIYINIDGTRYYVQTFSIKHKDYVKDVEEACTQVTYEEIRKYLPEQVIVLGFDAVYKKLIYGNKYLGDRIVDYRDLESIYDITGRGHGYSKGVLHMLYAYYKDKTLRKTLNELGIVFSDYVDMKVNFNDSELMLMVEKDGKIANECRLIDWDEYIDDEIGFNSRFRIFDFIKKRNYYNALAYLIDNHKVYINEFYIKKGDTIVSMEGMSTGEKAFLNNLFYLLSQIDDNVLIIWEEPETHLNMRWSKMLIPLFAQFFKKYDAHILLSSHETHMIKNLFPSQIIRLQDAQMIRPDFNTFLANDVEITKRLFGDTSTNPFEEYILNELYFGDSNKREQLMNVLGESYLKFLLYKQMEY